MSKKAIAKLTQEEREEYQEIHQMSRDRSLWEAVAGAIAQAFSRIWESKIKSQAGSTLPS